MLSFVDPFEGVTSSKTAVFDSSSPASCGIQQDKQHKLKLLKGIKQYRRNRKITSMMLLVKFVPKNLSRISIQEATTF